jgi:hypothetical protein
LFGVECSRFDSVVMMMELVWIIYNRFWAHLYNRTCTFIASAQGIGIGSGSAAMYTVGEIIVARPRGNVATSRAIIANARLACNVAGTGGTKDVVGCSCAQGCINFLLTSAIL